MSKFFLFDLHEMSEHRGEANLMREVSHGDKQASVDILPQVAERVLKGDGICIAHIEVAQNHPLIKWYSDCSN